MGTEDEIRTKLLQGYEPQQLVDEGFRKSTVYKVAAQNRLITMSTPRSAWVVENYTFPNFRYLPGQNIPVNFSFRNTSPLDLYVHRIGVRAEWMRDQWHAQEVRDLVKSGGQKWFSFPLAIPSDVQLGEYQFFFGVEGQYLPSSDAQQVTTQWSEPIFVEIKKPQNGLHLFLSHSTENMGLVRKLERQLDIEGIGVVIAENRIAPGVVLEQKFQRLIGESSMFMALLTEEGINSKWVLQEANYALQIRKPTILLKEKQVTIATSLEWVPFSINDPPEVTFQTIMRAIAEVRKRVQADSLNQAAGAIVGIAVLAFIASLFSSGSKK
ncbi:MAG TPA: TIR domain-containing protein [Nitrososphaerales archaeon]|nr:TIR domain-containing protein [Nitrososphaerales archaeon]